VISQLNETTAAGYFQKKALNTLLFSCFSPFSKKVGLTRSIVMLLSILFLCHSGRCAA